MKKTFLALLGSVCLLCSCQQDEIEKLDEVDNFVFDENADYCPKRGGDLIYDFLGYGYDATGKFANSNSVRQSVLDIDKFTTMFPGDLDVDDTPHTWHHQEAGETSYKYVSNFSKSWEVGGGFSLFTANVTSSYSTSSGYSQEYSFASATAYYRMKRLSMYAPEIDLQECLTDGFKKNLGRLTGAQIVKMYGTHVLTRISLGGKVSYFYRSIINESNKETIAKSGISAGIGSLFKSKFNTEVKHNIDTRNKEQILDYEMIGGNITLVSSGRLFLERDSTVKDLSSWEQSINKNENIAFIEINEDGLVPIWELITDPVKKDEVKVACMEYIKGKQLVEEAEDLSKTTLVLHSGNAKNIGSYGVFSPNKVYNIIQIGGEFRLIENGKYVTSFWRLPQTGDSIISMELTYEGELIVKGFYSDYYLYPISVKAGSGSKLLLNNRGDLLLYDKYEELKWKKEKTGLEYYY